MWFKSKNDEQKLADRLHSERLKSSIILNAIEDGVVVVGKQGIIQLFNPGASKITGWPSSEAEGLDWRLVFKLVDDKGQALPESAAAIDKVLKHGQSAHDNAANLVTKTKNNVGVSFSVSPLIDETNQLTGAIAIFRDVTEERKEEGQRADFISTASHEMRTPVAAIEGYLSLALNDKVATIDARARNYLDKAHSSTEHLGRLFQDLLTSAKAEDGRLTNHPRIVEIGAFLEQLAGDLRFAAEKKGLMTDFVVSTGQTPEANAKVIRPLYYITADPDRLREAITNIFDNAVKYTDQGKVSIGLTGNDQVVQLYIRDTGPGIPTEDIPHLFQKFYRVDNSATRTVGGTGLGLFICQKIVELYQGRLWVESTLGKGSTFFINLPRLTTQEAERRQTAEAQSTELKPITSLGQSVVQ